jgi:hypothetical protein
LPSIKGKKVQKASDNHGGMQDYLHDTPPRIQRHQYRLLKMRDYDDVYPTLTTALMFWHFDRKFKLKTRLCGRNSPQIFKE